LLLAAILLWPPSVPARSAALEDALDRLQTLEQIADPGLGNLIDEGLTLALDEHDADAEARLRVAQARFNVQRGRWGEVLESARQGVDAARRSGNSTLEADALVQMAAAEQTLGDYSQATERLLQAERLMAGTPPGESQVRLYLSLSSLFGRTGDTAGGLRAVDRGLALARQLPLPVLQVQLLLNRARLLSETGDLAGQLDALRAAEDGVRRLERPDLLATVLLGLSSNADARGDAADEARGHAREALEIASRIGNSDLAAYAHRNLADAEQALGRVAAAEAALRSALELSTGNPELLAALHERLAELLLDNDREAEAAGTYREALAQRRLLLQGQQKAALDRLKIEVEASESRREVLRLQIEAEAQRAELAEQRSRQFGLAALALLALLAAAVTGIWLHLTRRRGQIVEAEAQASARMLAFASHEVRNPVHGIAGLAELLLGTRLDAQQRHWADTILRASDSLSRLADDFLQHARLRLGHDTQRRRPTAIREVLDAVVTLERPEAAAAGIELSVELDPGLSEWLLLDGARLRQVLLNLVSNAIRYSGARLIRLRASPASDGQGLRLEVEDTGRGMSPAELATLFRPFVQGQQGQQSMGGTGLGLSISKDLVQAMGGRLHAESASGKGTRFSFELPAPSSDAPRLRPDPTTLGGRPLDVIVVDDNAANLTLALSQLEQLGHRPRGSTQPAEALDWVTQATPDLLIVDYQMPLMDGVELARVARARVQADLKVLAVSGHDRAGAGLPAGIDGWLLKPVSVQQLAEAIDRVLCPSTPPGARGPTPAPATRDRPPALLDGDTVAELHRLRKEGQPLFVVLARDFLDGLDARLAGLRTAFAAEDRAALARRAHRWRGSAAALVALFAADAMFARQAAAESQHGFDQRVATGGGAGHFFGVIGMHHQIHMQIAVAGMAETDNGQSMALSKGVDGVDQRQARHRHHHILVDLQRRDFLHRMRQRFARHPQCGDGFGGETALDFQQTSAGQRRFQRRDLAWHIGRHAIRLDHQHRLGTGRQPSAAPYSRIASMARRSMNSSAQGSTDCAITRATAAHAETLSA
jgi:signal transduction histidine kinase/ActR/RegA family two-component response regulator